MTARLRQKYKRLSGYDRVLTKQFAGGTSGAGVFTSLAYNEVPMECNDAEMSIVIHFANGQRRDSVNDLLEIGGINTERHRKNSIVGFDHFKAIQLPIGLSETRDTREYTVTLDVPNQRAYGKCFIWDGSGGIDGAKKPLYDHAVFCNQCYALAKSRILVSGSIGYTITKGVNLPAEYDKGLGAGIHILACNLLEYSLTVIPANQDTVVKSFPSKDAYGEYLDGLKTTVSRNKVEGKPLAAPLYKSLSSAIPSGGLRGYWSQSYFDRLQEEEATYV